MKQYLAACAAAVAVFTFTACTEPTAPGQISPTLTAVTVTLASPTLTVGGTTQATANGRDQDDAPIATGTVTWTSTANASVSSDGVVTAVSPGTATIIANAGGITGQATVTISALPAAALTLTTAPPSTSASRAPFTTPPVVRLVNSANGTVAQAGVVVTVATSSGALIGANTATTDANGVATFSGLGLSGTIGARTLTFTAAGLTSTTANVTLTAGAPTNIAVNGGNQQTVNAGSIVPVAPSVMVTDADGNVVSGAQVDFTITAGAGSLTGASATTNASGIATLGSWTLGAPGLNTLQAKVAGQSAAVALSAMATQAPALTTINVVLFSTNIQVGQTTQASAIGVDQYGANIAMGNITWTSNSANATVTASGMVTAVAAGSAVITASASGKSGQATITVAAPPVPVVPVVTSISVSVAPSAIQVGQTAQASVSALDQFGASIAPGTVTWSISGGATINSAGVVTGVTAGQAQITAQASGKFAQGAITITTAPVTPVLSSLVMSISPSTIQVGQTAQVAVSGRDQFGLPFPPGPIMWLATNNVTISANGLVTGTSAGTATITANAGGFSVQQDLVVSGAPTNRILTSMTMSFSATTIHVGETSQATVTGYDQFGIVMPTGPVNWYTSGFSSISSTGLITALAVGPVHVVAIVGSVGVGNDITITAAPPPTSPTLTSIVVTLSPSTIVGGDNSQATAQGLDQFGAPIATGPITWSLPSAVTPRMSISPTGLITTQLQFGGSGIDVTATAGTVTGSAPLTVRVATKITVTFAKAQVLIGETNDATIAAFDGSGNPINVPLGVSQYCPATNCGGKGSIVRNSNTSVTVTAVDVGQFTLQVNTPTGPGGTNYFGYASFNIVKPPELTSMAITWPTNLSVGQTVTIPVAGRDQFGAPFPLGAVAYYAYPTYLVSIDAFGALTVLRPGTFSVTIIGKRADGTDMTYTQTFTVPGTPTARLQVTTSPVSPIINRSQLPSNQPVTVQVVDIASGQPVAWSMLPITAALTSGGGTFTGTKSAPSSGAGNVPFNDWTFGGTAGPRTVTFTAPGVNSTSWQFTLQATGPSGIALNAGNNQTAQSGTAVPIKPTVKVTDIDGNAVSGVSVVFTVLTGGGSVTGASVTTDANGLAQVGSWTLGAGSNTLKAQAANVGSTITFTATGN